MDIDIINQTTNLMIGEEFIDLPFSSNIDELFSRVLEILAKNNYQNKQDLIIKNTSAVLNLLINNGNTYESEVLETAMIYIVNKYCDIKIDEFKELFNNFSLAAAMELNKFNGNLKVVFENDEYPYISKIKIADLIFELKENPKDKNIKSLSKSIIDEYKERTQKGLMNLLISMLVEE